VAVGALGAKWHQNCFKCGVSVAGLLYRVKRKSDPRPFARNEQGCEEPFKTSSFFPKDGKAFCQECYTATL
jgi:hypothetical protein